LSHAGLVRRANEDHFITWRRDGQGQIVATNLPADSWRLDQSPVHVLAVADGLGGAVGGAWASKLALTAARRRGNTQVSWLADIASHDPAEFASLFNECVLELHENLLREAQISSTLRGMGTTLTVACGWGNRLLLGHVGDSRAYLLRSGELHQLTTDHTLAEDLIRTGAAAEAVKRVRHVLTNSLGGEEGSVRADIQEFRLEAQDQLLLCSDGLSDVVTAADILAIMRQSESAAVACEQLVQRALEAGGRDNVTCVVARLPATNEPSR
jgi:protein phosphatase